MGGKKRKKSQGSPAAYYFVISIYSKSTPCLQVMVIAYLFCTNDKEVVVLDWTRLCDCCNKQLKYILNYKVCQGCWCFVRCTVQFKVKQLTCFMLNDMLRWLLLLNFVSLGSSDKMPSRMEKAQG